MILLIYPSFITTNTKCGVSPVYCHLVLPVLPGYCQFCVWDLSTGNTGVTNWQHTVNTETGIIISAAIALVSLT